MASPPAPGLGGQRTRSILALALLIALAGCNLPVPSDPQYPPGVTESGVVNATSLANAHTDTLRQGYRMDEYATYTAANETIVLKIEDHKRWSPMRATRTVTYSSAHPMLGVHGEVYATDDRAYVRVTHSNGTVTTHYLADYRPRVLISGPGLAWETIYAMAAAPTTSVTTLANGTIKIRFTNATMGLGTGNGTLYVTPEGFIKRYSVTYERRWLTEPITAHRTVEYSHVGEPNVVTPDWVANVSTNQ